MNSTYPALTHRRSRVARGGTLVLGGGFAGSYVARQVGQSGATIVNPTNFMLYTPLLPEAAAGSVEPRHVTVPLRTMCPHADLVLGSVTGLDAQRRVVQVESEAGDIEIAYADLVIALGAVARMPDLPGLREHALGLKDLVDAIRLRNHVLRQIELADAVPESAARRLTFVLAGAGFAGVEAVAELNELVSDALTRHPRLDGVQPRWVLVEGGHPHPAPDAREARRVRGQAARPARRRDPHGDDAHVRRRRRGDALRRAPDRHRDGRLDGRRHGQPAARKLGLPLDKHGRVPVDETLRVLGSSRIWALGDCAAVPNEATPGETDPATCQHALRQARRLARNLRGTPRAYSYRTRGQMATLGSRHGIALVGGMRVKGVLGWIIARGYHVLQLPFAARRARVLADWTAAALFRRDVAELSSSTAVKE